jgi:hypothetical protein
MLTVLLDNQLHSLSPFFQNSSLQVFSHVEFKSGLGDPENKNSFKDLNLWYPCTNLTNLGTLFYQNLRTPGFNAQHRERKAGNLSSIL